MPDSVPGDIADIEVRERRGTAHRGHLVTLVRPSTLRVRPRCPLFDRCGGCQWQRLQTEAQAEYKGALVERVLHDAGFDKLPIRIVPAASPWAYRTAGTYVPVETDRGAALGLHGAAGPSPIPIDGCVVQSPALQKAFEETQRAWRALMPRLRSPLPGTVTCRQVRIRVGEASAETAVGLVLDGRLAPAHRDAVVTEILTNVARVVEITAVETAHAPRTTGKMSSALRWGRPGVVDAILGYWYQVPVLAPFPVTGRAASTAVSLALEALALDGDATLLETDAGIGGYTLPAAGAARSVIARTDPEHLDAARHNAAWNDASNAVFVDRASHTLAGVMRSYGPFHRALVHLVHDAPRFETFREGNVERIVVVAGSPARLAAALTLAGAAGFETRAVTVIDTHPQTSRAEIHATLDARSKAWTGTKFRALEGSAQPVHRPRRTPRPPSSS